MENINTTSISASEVEPQVDTVITQTEPPKKGKKWWLILIAVLLLATTGYFAYKYITLKDSIQNTSQETSIPTSVFQVSTDSTEGWKKYENKEWGFSVKYPEKDFTACYPVEGLKLWGPNFNCGSPKDIFYIISFTGSESNNYKEIKTPSKTETVIVDGKNATKNTYIFEEEDGPLFGLKEETEIVIPLQNGLIQAVLLGNKDTHSGLFNQILSTFKFIEQTKETSNWKTYENKNTGILFKYPTNFSYSMEDDPYYLISPDPLIKISIHFVGNPVALECVNKTEQITQGDLVVKKYQRIYDTESCGSADVDRTTIVSKSLSGDLPSVVFSYNSTKSTESEKVINQIINTLQFTK